MELHIWEKRYEPKSGTAHVGECFPILTSILIHLQAQAIFTLAWFHAIVQERRVFIPQGWAKFYEFSDGDLRAGLEVLDQLSKRSRSSSNLDWETVHGLYSNAIYGGRVDDVHDIRILCSYLQEFFKQDVISGNARPRWFSVGICKYHMTSYKFSALIG